MQEKVDRPFYSLSLFIFMQAFPIFVLSCNITHFHYCVKSTFLSQDEMFIFMEYCAEGTISDVSKNDLPEDMIRMYTNQILVAVSVLHEKGIVHRDVKGKVLFSCNVMTV